MTTWKCRHRTTLDTIFLPDNCFNLHHEFFDILLKILAFLVIEYRHCRCSCDRSCLHNLLVLSLLRYNLIVRVLASNLQSPTLPDQKKLAIAISMTAATGYSISAARAIIAARILSGNRSKMTWYQYLYDANSTSR